MSEVLKSTAKGLVFLSLFCLGFAGLFIGVGAAIALIFGSGEFGAPTPGEWVLFTVCWAWTLGLFIYFAYKIGSDY